ncbi:MAG: hypothetical protein ACRDTJ_18265 [Pseudonocardiaceae bacterium]
MAHPHMRAIREAVDTGEVGRIELIEANYLHGMSPGMVAALVKGPCHWARTDRAYRVLHAHGVSGAPRSAPRRADK